MSKVKKGYSSSKTKLFLIDDDEDIVNVLEVIFDQNKADLPEYKLFTKVDKFFDALTPDVNICVIDYYLKERTGLEIIKRINKTNPQCWFIMFSGQDRLKVIVEFMNHSYGSRYVEKGQPNSATMLLYYIKEITDKINAIESYFYESFKNKESLSELKNSLTDLKAKI